MNVEPRSAKESVRLHKLNTLISDLWERNRFYRAKWLAAGLRPGNLRTIDDLAEYPFTTRAELLADQAAAPPLGTNLSCPVGQLKRFHRSSGTTHNPIFWGDDDGSWVAVLDCSEALWRMSGVLARDRVCFLTPFSRSSGPWIMYEGALRLGCACLPAGAVDLIEQVRWLHDFSPDVLAGHPSTLLSIARADHAVARAGARSLILTGGCEGGVREELESRWEAELFDRYGLTEAGSVACECGAHCGALHVLDEAMIAECIDPVTKQRVANGQTGELVLTHLTRSARPIVRYRTGDLVQLASETPCACGRTSKTLLGRVLRNTTI